MNKIRAAKAERQIMERQRDELTEKMDLEIQQTWHQFSESQLEVAMNTLALEQAEENLKTTRNQYEAGMETLANYLEAQTLWQEASLTLLESKIAQHLNETYYLKAMGRL
jgi:outer membrane protein TolC